MKNKMKIAVPTNDRDIITPRSGRTKGFLILTINGSEIVDTDYRLNPHDHDKEEKKHVHSHGSLMKVLKDCEVMVGNRVGSHLKEDLDAAGISIYLSKEKEVNVAVREYLDQL